MLTDDLDAHLAAIAAGDAAAFARWLAGAEPRVRAGLRRYARHVDTEAVLQEALLRAWQLAPKIAPDGRPNALLRFTARVAHNLCVDELRRTRAVALDPETLERAADREAAMPAVPDLLLRKTIAACHAELDGKPALALAQRLASGGAEPDEVLAARIGMRLNTFLQNVTRARKLLAACLEKHGVRLEEELR